MSDGFFARSKVKSKQPQSKIPKCGQCKLNKGCISPQMPYTGEGKKKILIIAEAPGLAEDEQNTQLIGDAGKLLRKLLRKCKIDLDKDCWKTNAVICRPPKNRTPVDKEIVACRPYLFKTIEETKPNVIIPLGATAVKSLIDIVWGDPADSLSRWLGQKIPCQTLNAWICPTYHPSYLLRTKNTTAELITKRHLKAACRLKNSPWRITNPSSVPDYKKDITIEHSPRLAAKWLKEKREYGCATFDYETNMLKPDSELAEIDCCSVCFNNKRTIAFPWHGEVIDAMIDLFKSPIKKIAANIKFEDRWTRRILKTKIRNWHWDTVLAAHILNHKPGVSGTKFQAFVQLGQQRYDKHLDNYLKGPSSNEPNRIKELDLDDRLIYCGMDSLVEHKIAMIQMKEFGIK